MLHALDHVVIGVRDLGAAAERYAALLGRPPSWRGVHDGAGTANVLFRVDNTYLELLSPAGEGPVGVGLAERLAARGEGLVALAFGTPDAAAFAASLRARGIAAGEPQDGAGRDSRSGAVRSWRTTLLPPASSRGLVVFAVEHRSPDDRLPRRTPAAGERSAVAALDHVVVLSSDLDAARRFYGETLGLRLALDRAFPDRGLRILFFRVGSGARATTVEVVGRAVAPQAGSGREGRATARDEAGAGGPGAEDRFGGLAWRVSDVAAARGRLAAGGFDVTDVRPGAKPGTRVCTVRDGTRGVATLLIEPAAAGAPIEPAAA